MTGVVNILFDIIDAALSDPTDTPILFWINGKAPGLCQRRDVMMSKIAGAVIMT